MRVRYVNESACLCLRQTLEADREIKVKLNVVSPILDTVDQKHAGRRQAAAAVSLHYPHQFGARFAGRVENVDYFTREPVQVVVGDLGVHMVNCAQRLDRARLRPERSVDLSGGTLRLRSRSKLFRDAEGTSDVSSCLLAWPRDPAAGLPKRGCPSP